MTGPIETLAALEVPGPTVTELTRPFWEAASDGRLLIQKCGSCGHMVFYPRSHCSRCWSEDLSWVEARGTGRLKSFSHIHKPGHPGWVQAAPYTVILVELDEGPTMLSHLVGAKDGMAVGDRLRLRPTRVGGRVLPCFEVAR
ncbi:Zn-ribbon domain-containing OB-fold protein [Hoeflea sp.]|uniref:Zn-ribbon domain-containing OB-fold protein n=1 Tax=Hoeflea sp. TaxID=1940281 RepID=UPI003B016B2E